MLHPQFLSNCSPSCPRRLHWVLARCRRVLEESACSQSSCCTANPGWVMLSLDLSTRIKCPHKPCSPLTVLHCTSSDAGYSPVGACLAVECGGSELGDCYRQPREGGNQSLNQEECAVQRQSQSTSCCTGAQLGSKLRLLI